METPSPMCVPEPAPADGGWSPVATTVACDWCGECPWCLSLHAPEPEPPHACHADGAGPCLAACCPIAGQGPLAGHLRPCYSFHVLP